MKHSVYIVIIVLLCFSNLYFFNKTRQTKDVSGLDDLFSELPEYPKEKPKSELSKELEEAKAELNRIYLYTAEVHVLDSETKEPIQGYSVTSFPSFTSGNQVDFKKPMFLWKDEAMNILTPVASEPFRSTIKAPGYDDMEIDLSVQPQTNPILILMNKNPNQRVEPIVKTPVD